MYLKYEKEKDFIFNSHANTVIWREKGPKKLTKFYTKTKQKLNENKTKINEYACFAYNSNPINSI